MRIGLLLLLLLFSSCSKKAELKSNETLLFGQVTAKEGIFEKGYIKYYRPYLPTNDYKIVHIDSTGNFNFIIDKPDVYKFEVHGKHLDIKEFYVDMYENDTIAFNVELGKIPFPKDSTIDIILERDGGYNMSSPIPLKKLKNGFGLIIKNIPEAKKLQRFIMSYQPIEGLLENSNKRFYVDSLEVKDNSISYYIPYSKFTFGIPQSTLNDILNAEYIVYNQKMIEFLSQGYNTVIKRKGEIKDFNENGIEVALDYAEHLLSQMKNINNKLIFGADLHSQLNKFTNRFITYHNNAMDLMMTDELFAARVPSYLFGLPLLNYLVGSEDRTFNSLDEIRPFQKEALSHLDKVLNRDISDSKRLKLLVIKYSNYGSVEQNLAIHTLEEIINLYPFSSEAVEARRQMTAINERIAKREKMAEEIKKEKEKIEKEKAELEKNSKKSPAVDKSKLDDIRDRD